MSGALVLVATPIGNLGDISLRAIDALRDADAIACEDTRHSRKLLSHVGITNSLVAVHEHNEMQAAEKIVDRIAAGETIALITDAGMPAISDPGERVVAAVAAAGLKVTVIPGPSAVLAAVAVSGLSTERFAFEGFLPRKASAARSRAMEIASDRRTTVLYEAPHRLGATVALLGDTCGADRRIALVRELTKIHEEVWRGSCGQLAERLEANSVKGECVLVVEGASESEEVDDQAIIDALEEWLSTGVRKSEAVAQVATDLGIARNRVYGLANSKK